MSDADPDDDRAESDREIDRSDAYLLDLDSGEGPDAWILLGVASEIVREVRDRRSPSTTSWAFLDTAVYALEKGYERTKPLGKKDVDSSEALAIASGRASEPGDGR